MKYQITLNGKTITITKVEGKVFATNEMGAVVSLDSVMFNRTDINGSAARIEELRAATLRGGIGAIRAVTRLQGWRTL